MRRGFARIYADKEKKKQTCLIGAVGENSWRVSLAFSLCDSVSSVVRSPRGSITPITLPRPYCPDARQVRPLSQSTSVTFEPRTFRRSMHPWAYNPSFSVQIRKCLG